MATCGEVIMSARASFNIAPHSGVGGCAPMPMNDRLGRGDDRRARSEVKVDHDRGDRPRKDVADDDGPVRRADAPRRLDERQVLERERVAANQPRERRMLKIETATMTLIMPPPRIATMPMARRMPGNANSTSHRRMMIRSHHPS